MKPQLLRVGVFVSVSLLLTALFTGCATPTVLPPEARAKVQQTEARSYIPQNEVNLQFMMSSYGSGGGLIGAIVDASINAAMASSAEARAKQIRQTVKDFDFRAHYWEAISNSVADVKWMQLQNLKTVPGGVERVTREATAEKSVLNIGTDYFISPNTKVFEITTGIGFFVPGDDGIDAANMMTYYSAEIGNVEGDDAMKAWMTDNGAPLRAAAKEGVDESARMLWHALNLMGGEVNNEAKPARVNACLVQARGSFGIPMGKIGLHGRILDMNDTRLIFQHDGGHLYSFPRKEVDVELLSEN
jgi:hypothetical protein